MALESKFKSQLIADIQRLYPGAIILKTDANQIQGMVDNIILYENRWAGFEAKRSKFSPFRPNQNYYIRLLNQMSFAQAVYPENKEEFLYDLQLALRP